MATLNLFQIVSKQLKETAPVSLEDTHKQLDMVGGGRGAGASREAASGRPESVDLGPSDIHSVRITQRGDGDGWACAEPLTP